MGELRWFGRAVVSAGVMLAAVAWSAGESWAYKGIAIIVGEAQGLIQGDHLTSKSQPGTILLKAMGVSARRPFDAPSGLPTGQLQPAPFKIFKDPDKATPKLLQALATSESLSVEIRWFRPVPGSSVEQHYFTIKLENASIAGIETGGDVTVAGGVLEEIQFLYQTITFTDVINGTSAVLNWQSSPF